MVTECTYFDFVKCCCRIKKCAIYYVIKVKISDVFLVSNSGSDQCWYISSVIDLYNESSLELLT